MPTPRNDTLSAKVIDDAYLIECDTLICLDWQTHQIIASCIVVLLFGFFTTIVTYQFCCITVRKKYQLKRNIKCLSLCYFWCGFTLFLCLLLFAILVFQPITAGGWEYNEEGGWMYDSYTPGWIYENDDSDWQWNDNGSYQWTSDGGWYYSGEFEFDMAWLVIWSILFWIVYLTPPVVLCSSYLYAFFRLHNSFLGSQYQLTKNENNIHYLNAVLIFFLNLFASFLHAAFQQKTVHNLSIAITILYSLGLGLIMYQFNKRLLDLVSKQQTEFSSSRTEISFRSADSEEKKQKAATQVDQIQKSAIQIELINVVVKHSLLSSLQLITFGLCAISSLIFITTTTENEEIFYVGDAHIIAFWIRTIQTICISSCIFLGFSSNINSRIYAKLCFLCHQQMNKICQNISTKRILQKEVELNLQTHTQKVSKPTDLSPKENSVTSVDIINASELHECHDAVSSST